MKYGVIVQTGTTGVNATVEWYDTEEDARTRGDSWARTSIALAPADARTFVVSVVEELPRQASGTGEFTAPDQQPRP